GSFVLGVPRVRGEVPKDRHQRRSNRGIVAELRAVPDVVAAERGQGGYKLVRTVVVRDERDDRLKQSFPLWLHVRWKHRANLGVLGEQLAIEGRHELMSDGRYEAEALREEPVILGAPEADL